MPIKERCITTSPSGSPAGFEPRTCGAASTGRLSALYAVSLGWRRTTDPFPLVLLHYRRWGGRGVSLPQHHAIKILPVGLLVQSKQKTSADKHFLRFSIDFFAPSTGATTVTTLSIFF